MSYYKVNGEDLTAVADAIREKGGTEAPLEFPAEFISAVEAISGGAEPPHIYGVSWPLEGGVLTASAGTRTDEAENFAEPAPSVNGAAGSSPFDELQPWAGMVVSQDQIAGAMVAIPRFWYKWTQTAAELKLQIATGPVAGFSISPAHADRGDGKGERETVYIARYKCAGSSATSISRGAPVTSIPRYFVRTLLKYGANLDDQRIVGSDYGVYQQDVAMFWTVRMLMLVEYANWNGQAVLGYGCGAGGECPQCNGTGTDPETGNTCASCDGSGVIAEQQEPLPTGTTDDMPYHTGTMQPSLDTYGQGIQYRHIEDMWAGCAEWLDGFCTDTGDYDSRCMYLQTNPRHYADIPTAMADVMDESDAENWPEWIAANVDLLNNSYDGDDPSDYFDAETMQAIGAYCAQSGDYMPEYGNLGGKVAVCVAIADTKIFRKRVDNYHLDSGTLYARTGYFKISGQNIRVVLDLSGGSMHGEDEDGQSVMDQSEMFMALIGSSTVDAVKIGKRVSGWIGGWSFPENAGLGWFGIPVTDGVGSAESKVADYCGLGNPPLCCGAAWPPGPVYGPFYLNSVGAGVAGDALGARLQKLP